MIQMYEFEMIPRRRGKPNKKLFKYSSNIGYGFFGIASVLKEKFPCFKLSIYTYI